MALQPSYQQREGLTSAARAAFTALTCLPWHCQETGIRSNALDYAYLFGFGSPKRHLEGFLDDSS